MIEFESGLIDSEKKQINKCVVRLRTTMYSDKKGIHIKKSLTFLLRQCEGYNIIEEDSSNVGAEEIFHRIINFDKCEDGIYEVIPCNERHDYETGYIEYYDYKLVNI